MTGEERERKISSEGRGRTTAENKKAAERSEGRLSRLQHSMSGSARL